MFLFQVNNRCDLIKHNRQAERGQTDEAQIKEDKGHFEHVRNLDSVGFKQVAWRHRVAAVKPGTLRSKTRVISLPICINPLSSNEKKIPVRV